MSRFRNGLKVSRVLRSRMKGAGKCAFLLFLIILFTACPGLCVQAEGEELSENEYSYCVYDDTAHITGYTGTDTELILPAVLGGYEVRFIDYCAFENNTVLTSVTIPEGYTYIGNGAFSGCCSLSEVQLPSTLTVIGERAFNECVSLTSIDFPDHLSNIQEQAFFNTGLTSVTLPDSLNTNDSYEAAIGEAALGYYYNSKSDVYGTVSGFNINGKENSEAYFYALDNGFLFNGEPVEGYLWTLNEDGKTVTVNGYRGSEVNLVIPSELGGYPVTAIGSYGFEENSKIQSIVFPDTITEIPYNAFWGCSSLKSVAIPDSVTSIGSCAFVNTGLTEVSLPDKLVSIDDYAFGYSFHGTAEDCFNDDGNSLGSMEADPNFSLISAAGSQAENYAVANKMLFNGSKPTAEYSYCSYAIYDESYENILEDGYAITGYNGAGGDVALPSTHDGKPIFAVYTSAFFNCDTITGLTIPEGCKAISDTAFYGCSNLTYVSLPSSLEWIGYFAFGNCPELSSVEIRSEAEISYGAFGYLSECEHFTYDDEGFCIPGNCTLVPGFTIYGITGTFAEQYAEENHFAFVLVSAEDNSGSAASSETSTEAKINNETITSDNTETENETGIIPPETRDTASFLLFGGLISIIAAGIIYVRRRKKHSL